ncbi:hypothetical protein BJF78_00445 [Pseudonocardia sp. CNS-139]|nr:hypothetical protein BJF78_00445 [Pseudonocardia sp. CNS-139]
MACGALGLLVRRLDGLHLGMATIAFDLIVMVGIMNGGDFTGGTEGLFGVPATLPSWLVLLVVAGIVGLAAASERGRLGRRLEAVRLDPELSVTAGISVTRVRVAVFVVSAVIGAIAGGVNVTFRTIATPADMGFPVVVLTLTMIIVGGTGSWVGALVGAVFFTWLPSTLQFVGEWQEVVYGAIVAVVAIWVPGGVVGVLREARHRRRSRRRPAALPGRSRLVTGAQEVPMLEVDGLSVHFGGVRAVDDVSFAVEAGLLYGIMGPNGSGKSTLLAAVTRLVTPTAGTVRLHGEDVTRLAPERLAARGVARSFQTARLLPTMSVRENVALGATCGTAAARPGPGAGPWTRRSPVRWSGPGSPGTPSGGPTSSPTVTSAASRSRGPSPWSPRSSFSTSRRPG